MIPTIFCLSFYLHFMVVIIITYTDQQSIDYRHYTLVGQLNSSVAGLGIPDPSGVVLIYNKARCVSELVSLHCLIVHFKYLIHMST